MSLYKLTLKDKKTFNKFLSSPRHELSVYAFENIYIWQSLYTIRWTIIKDSLCIFFKDNLGTFLYLPPLGKNSVRVIEEVFSILDQENKNPEVSRIENIEEADLGFYQNAGYACIFKAHDYICLREDLINLRGNKFKSQRASLNFFLKHYDFNFQPLSLKDRKDCLKLYHQWMRARSLHNPEALYQGMMKDSSLVLRSAFKNYTSLGFCGAVVEVNNELKAFTFGFPINKEAFCILYEITDLSIKGLAQFIFHEFASGLKNYKYINIMDDSGLENLKKVKLSYHPKALAPAYIAQRKNA